MIIPINDIIFIVLLAFSGFVGHLTIRISNTTFL